MTERRKLRCGEPSRMQKVAVSMPSIHYKFRQSSIQKEHDCLF